MADYLFGITDTGRIRNNNEDVFIAKEVMDRQFIIAGVIDGVGGYAGGEVAAAITKAAILDELSVIGTDIITQLELAFNLANEEILAKKLMSQDLPDMACVATLAVIDKKNNQLYYIHVGDTRLYLFRDHSLVKISHDQSFVGFMEDSGRITEEEAMAHPKRNQINQALGFESRMGKVESYFETGSSPFLPGDIILVCSDGLTDLVDKAGIVEVLSIDQTLKSRAVKLMDKANNAGGKDNITVVLAKNDKIPVHHNSTRPANHPKPAPESMPVPARQQSLSLDEAPLASPPSDTPLVSPDIKEHSNKIYKVLLLLSGVCAILLAATIWLYITRPQIVPEKIVPERTVKAIVPAVTNSQEKLIADTLSHLKGNVLMLSDALVSSPVLFSKALTINRDTLIIKTSGDLIFRSDSSYKGPAMVLSPGCRYISINNIILENFDTGIVSYDNALALENVRFSKVKQPVQVLFSFPDRSFVSGRVSKHAYQSDSLAKSR